MSQKICRLEERYIEEEINGDLYNKFLGKYVAEKGEIEQNILKTSKQVSNLEDCMNTAIEFASKMPFKWLSANYLVKQHLQFLVFPEGIDYCKKNDGCRTNRINSVFLYIAYFQQIITNKKSGIPELNLNFAALAGLVAPTGIVLKVVL